MDIGEYNHRLGTARRTICEAGILVKEIGMPRINMPEKTIEQDYAAKFNGNFFDMTIRVHAGTVAAFEDDLPENSIDSFIKKVKSK